jgi:hypothetical protein
MAWLAVAHDLELRALHRHRRSPHPRPRLTARAYEFFDLS